MSLFEIILIVLIVGMMALLLFMTKVDKELVNLTQFTDLCEMYDDVSDRMLMLKKYLEEHPVKAEDIDDALVSYIYLTGKSDGIYEAVEKSKKIAEKIIY